MRDEQAKKQYPFDKVAYERAAQREKVTDGVCWGKFFLKSLFAEESYVEEKKKRKDGGKTYRYIQNTQSPHAFKENPHANIQPYIFRKKTITHHPLTSLGIITYEYLINGENSTFVIDRYFWIMIIY